MTTKSRLRRTPCLIRHLVKKNQDNCCRLGNAILSLCITVKWSTSEVNQLNAEISIVTSVIEVNS